MEYLWRQAIGGAVMGRPTVQAQSVVVVQDGGSVKAYSVSGRPLWTFSARGRLSPYVTRSREGTVYICRTNGVFIAVNRSGRELWRTNVGGTLFGPTVLGWDGRVFIPTATKMVCYTASGNLLWTKELESVISAGPWLDQAGGVLLALEDGNILRIDPFGRSTAWQLPSVPRYLLSVKRHAAPNTAPAIMVLYRNGDAQLIDPSVPNAVPVTLPSLPSSPLAAASREGYVAVALANGQAVLLSGIDGTLVWTADTHARLYAVSENDATVIYDDRGVYVLTAGGATSFSEDGRRQWFTRIENASSIPAFSDDGVLYSGGKDWILYAWKLEDVASNQKRTLYGPAPEGSYGASFLPPDSPFAGLPGRFDETYMNNELDTIRRGIQAGKVGAHEREWLASLMEIAGTRQGPFSYSRPRAAINQRIHALQLLARIGSHETIPWLARLFRTEKESLVKAAAARAIGSIGVDPEGLALREFMAFATLAHSAHDEQVLIAVAAATGALCRFSGPPLSDAGARILALLGSTIHMPSVRQQALRELEVLR